MQVAAEEYAAGKPVANPPPSLRVYTLAKQIPGTIGNPLDEDGQLWAELELYAYEEGRAQAEAARRRALQERRDQGSGRRGRGKFRRRTP